MDIFEFMDQKINKIKFRLKLAETKGREEEAKDLREELETANDVFFEMRTEEGLCSDISEGE